VIEVSLKEKNIILYDGYCNLCNASLQFIVKRDRKKVFQYFPIQSPEGELLSIRLADNNIPDSVILFSGGQFYVKSEAIFEILSQLGKGYNVLLIFKIIPKKFWDKLYDWIAANRYKWFGKTNYCRTPNICTSDESR